MNKIGGKSDTADPPATITINKSFCKSSSAAERTENGLPTPSLKMDTPISGVSTY